MRFVPLVVHSRYQPLLDAMKEFGYCDRMIYDTKRVILLVQDTPDERTDDFFLRIRQQNSQFKNRFFDLVQNFEQTGSLNLTPSFRRKPNGSSSKLIGEFKELMDYFDKKSIENCYCPSKIRTVKSPGAVFLLYLQNQGINTLKNFDNQAVINAFVSNHEGFYMDYIVKFLNTCSDYYTEKTTCNAIIDFFNYKSHRSKVTEILTEEESDKIMKVLVDNESNLSCEERAVGLIFFFTGLRQCDVQKLTLSDVDWNRSTISVIQSKTKRPVSVPLRPVVGNAIYTYLISERPTTSSLSLFLTPNKWNMPLTKAYLRKACNKIYDLANVRMESGRRGFHLFRHNIAIRLLEQDVDMSIISSALGHESPKSVEQYLGVTHKKLKECALSIDKYPLNNSIYGE